MTEELKEFLEEAKIINYRLSDSSYIIAQEIEYEIEDNYVSIINPVEIKVINDKTAFTTWIDCELDAIMRIDLDKIIASTEASIEYKSQYFKFFIYKQLKNFLTENEHNEYFGNEPNINPSFDNLDSSNYFKDRMNWTWDN